MVNSMLDLELFYEKTAKGENCDFLKMKDYLQSFSRIILWGAGNLGMEIAKLLKRHKIPIACFWDKRYEQIQEIDGIPVVEPYSESGNKKETLIVFSIATVPTGPALLRELRGMGWENVLKGIYLYQGFICPLSVDKPFDASVCAGNKFCTLCNCDMMNNIMIRKQAERKTVSVEELFAVERVHFIINNFCNLKCKYCNRYMNSYSVEKKKNSDYETVKYDIQRVMGAIDSVAVGIVFGGEPFLHLELDRIIGELLKQENLGAVLVNSNGVANIKDKVLKNLANPRVRVAFSNYTHVFDEMQKKKFWSNADYLKENGICIQVQNTEPTWTEATTLDYKGYDEKECIQKRKNCDFPYLFVYEHKVYPCSLGMTIHDLGIADYAGDYVNITEYADDKSLGLAIRELQQKDYFNTCAHCAAEVEKSVQAAEQGFDKRYAVTN